MTRKSTKNVWGLLIAILFPLAMITSCQQQEGVPETGSTEASAADGNWADSAYLRAKKAEYYYNNNMRDSLFMQVERDMAFDRKHGQWTWYYYSWLMMINKSTFSGDVHTALEEANKMHRDAASRDNDYGQALADYAMGLIYAFQDYYKEAAENLGQALELYPEDVDPSVKFSICSYYCTVLEQLKDFPTMRRVLGQWKDELARSQDNGDPATRAHWKYQYFKALFNHDYSNGLLDKATDDVDSIQYYTELSGNKPLRQAHLTGCRVRLFMAQKDYSKALEYSNHEYVANKKLDPGLYLQALDRRSAIYEQLGVYNEALAMRKEYTDLRDSISQADTRQQLNELNKRFELDELKAKHERIVLLHAIILASVIVVGLMIFIFFRHRAAKRLEREHLKLEDAYSQLTVANARANEASKMKTAFIQQISHEIRTPLNILSGFTQVITTPGMELSEEQRADINQRITENTDRISGLINKMLELSDALTMTVIERSDTVPAGSIAAEAVELSGIGRVAHVHFTLQTNETVDGLVLNTNCSQAVRALVLLLDNAKKFTHPAEALCRQRKDKLKEERVTLSLTQTADVVQYAVEDTGIGVPAEEAEHVFEEFVQLDDYYDGTGIGLTVARSIARRLGGEIVLDTSYTRGARFLFTLPKNLKTT